MLPKEHGSHLKLRILFSLAFISTEANLYNFLSVNITEAV